jgi:hypothetical protein
VCQTREHDDETGHVSVENTGVARVQFVQTEQRKEHRKCEQKHGNANGVIGRVQSVRESANNTLVLRDTFIETDGENHKHRKKNSDMTQKKGDESIYVEIIVNYFRIAAHQGGRIIAVVATTIIVFVIVIWQVTGR